MSELTDIENALIQKYNLNRSITNVSKNRVIISQYSEDINNYINRFIDMKIKDWHPGQGWACLHIPIDIDKIISITDNSIIGHKYSISYTKQSNTYVFLDTIDYKLPKIKIHDCTIPNVWSGQLWRIQINDGKMIIGYADKDKNTYELCTVKKL